MLSSLHRARGGLRPLRNERGRGRRGHGKVSVYRGGLALERTRRMRPSAGNQREVPPVGGDALRIDAGYARFCGGLLPTVVQRFYAATMPDVRAGHRASYRGVARPPARASTSAATT